MQQFEQSKEKDLSYYLELSKSYSGYQREQALIYLADVSDPVVFPVLLLRLNDYVPQVRAKAEQAMARWLVDASRVDLCLQYFADIAALETRKRVSEVVIQAFAAYLAQQKPLIKQILLKEQGKRSRALFEWAQKYEWFSPIELQDIARHSVDQAIRSLWVAVLELQKDNIELLELEVVSCFNDVRKLAYLLIAVNHPYVRWQALFVKALQSTDTRKGLRQLIIFYLKRQQFDFSGFVADLATCSDEKNALLLLDLAQELKQDLAASVALQLLESPAISVKFEAINYLIQFGYEDIVLPKLLGLVSQHYPLEVSKLHTALKYLKQLGKLSLDLVRKVISERQLAFEDAYLLAQLLYSRDRFILSFQLIVQLAEKNGLDKEASATLNNYFQAQDEQKSLSAEQKERVKTGFLALLKSMEGQSNREVITEAARELIFSGVVKAQDLPPFSRYL